MRFFLNVEPKVSYRFKYCLNIYMPLNIQYVRVFTLADSEMPVERVLLEDTQASKSGR